MVLAAVLPEGAAELLEVVAAAGDVHPFARLLDGGQEREQAGEEDAGGDGDVRQAKRDGDRPEVEDRSALALLAALGDVLHGAPRQAERRLVDLAVVQEPVYRARQSLHRLGR